MWIEGLYTHFAVADLPDKAFTLGQFGIFQDVRARLAAGYHIGATWRTAAALDLPEMHLDAVRVGIAMYGLRPSNEVTGRRCALPWR